MARRRRPISVLSLIVLLASPASRGLATVVEPRLVRDINTTPLREPTHLAPGSAVGNRLFLNVTDPIAGEELWTSDGSQTGTVRIKDIFAGPRDSSPSELTDVEGFAFFTAEDRNGRELWKSDGTEAGTVLVKDIVPGLGSSSPQELTRSGGTLFFTVEVAKSVGPGLATELLGELWRSDGTEAGTTVVKSFPGQVPGEVPLLPVGRSLLNALTDVNGTLFFVVEGSRGWELWKSDGTGRGTVRVKTFLQPPDHLTNVNGTLFLVGHDALSGRELWKSDGTEEGTVLVSDIALGTGSSYIEDLTESGGLLYFTAVDGDTPPHYHVNTRPPFLWAHPSSGRELWRSDGTEEGTARVKDIIPGEESSSPERLTSVNGELFFTAVREVALGQVRPALWKTDGTEAGTVLIKEIFISSRLTNMSGSTFFSSGASLWKSDGTSVGTVKVKDLPPPGPTGLAPANGTLFFSLGSQLWKSDGTDTGTVKLSFPDLGGNGSSAPYSLTSMNGALFFSAYTPALGWELWRSDGTEAGTVVVKDILPGPASSSPSELTVVGHTLFFIVGGPTNSWELWRSDGTDLGTSQVAEGSPASGLRPVFLTDVNGTLFFIAPTDEPRRWDLWKSDGSQAGTVKVKDADAFNRGFPHQMTNVDGTMFFVTSDSFDGDLYGANLWKSDGTEAGTVMIKRLRNHHLEPVDSVIHSLTAVGRTLYFSGYDRDTGSELWKSDGTAAGTVPVTEIAEGKNSSFPDNLTQVGGTLFFTAAEPLKGALLWKTDGTVTGTVKVKETRHSVYPFSPRDLTNVDGTLFFTAYEDATYVTGGRELWKSDGTDAGTVRVKDITPGGPTTGNEDGTLIGPHTTNPTELLEANGTLVFRVGEEYWKSDGTAAGTAPFAKACRWLDCNLVPVNSTLFFANEDLSTGLELWAIDL